jgi:ubiquinone/menaquinone biosynthesis C-methylase UbiE
MSINNDFSGSAKYYDLLSNKAEQTKKVKFVEDILKKHKVKTILDLGCGTGLYLIPLHKKGFKIEGLDISKEMLAICKKRNKKINLYLDDMSKFKINNKYDSIICMDSSLVLLPSFKLMEKTIKKCFNSLEKGGILILDLPNHKVEIKASNYTQDYSKYKIPGGQIDTIFRDYKKGDKWISEWVGFGRSGKKFFQFKEHYEELIFSVSKFEKVLKGTGFNIISIHGSRKGEKFYPKRSYRRLYICKKN